MRTASQIIDRVRSLPGCLTDEQSIIPGAVVMRIREDDRTSYPDTTIIVIEVIDCPDARMVRTCPSETGVILRQVEALLTPNIIHALLQKAVDMRLNDVRTFTEKTLLCINL